MASGTTISFHYVVRLPLTALGNKRSADEAGVATREDGAKRRESTGKEVKGGLKVCVSLGDSDRWGSVFLTSSHTSSYSGRARHPSFRFQSRRSPTSCRRDSHATGRRRRQQRVSRSK